MTNRTRVKKVLIVFVIAVFLVVTFGTFVAYLVGGKQQPQQSVQNEVQPTVVVPSTWTTTTWTTETVNTGNAVNND